MTGEKLLRMLIREEIGRSFMRGERVDFYPWTSDVTNVTIIKDIEGDQCWAYVEELSSGEVQKKLLPSEEEAQHWARQMSDVIRRKELSRDHK